MQLRERDGGNGRRNTKSNRAVGDRVRDKWRTAWFCPPLPPCP